MLSLEEQKAWLKKLSIYGGILQALSLGIINASYSDVRWPTSSGIRLLFDFIYVGLSNPYALLGGVLVYILFNRYEEKAEEMRAGKNDTGIFLLIGLLAIWTLILMQGIIVY